MIKKTSIYLAALITFVFLFGCTNEPLINSFIDKAHAYTSYPTTTTTTTTTLATASPTATPTLNTYNPPATPTATPTPTATVTPTPFICGSNGDSWCNGKEPGDPCTITEDINGDTLDFPVDGTCDSTCTCEFCETCNDCTATFSDGDFIGASDSPDSPGDPALSGSYRKMFKVTSSLEQIGSDLRQIKESRKNKTYKKKSKFVRNYKENNDGTVSVLLQSRAKDDNLNIKQSWLKFRVGTNCTKMKNVGTAARPRNVADGCKDPDPCPAPCEKCQKKVSAGVVNQKCCECRLKPDLDPVTAGDQAAQCSPDHDNINNPSDQASCKSRCGENHKCDVTTAGDAGAPDKNKCKCKCGNDAPCDKCETCNGAVNPNVCALKKGNTCGSAAFGCNGAFVCDKNASGSACFCGCNVDADCTAGANHGCCKLGDEAVKHCHECCKDGDCAGATPKCCVRNNKGQIGICGNLNVDGCVPIAP